MNSLTGGSLLRGTLVSFAFLLLPILGVLGPTVLSSSGSNAVLLLLIGSIAVLFLVTVACESIVPSRYYPLAIVTISVSLSFHYVLISPYLVGWDVNREYFFFRLVSGGGHWDSTYPDSYNSALSITVLPTMLSSVLGVDGVVIFKVVYQLVFSLVPLILYFAYREQIGARPAFIAMAFMMSYQSYYMELSSVTRQEIAEVILACLVLLMMSRRVRLGDRGLLRLLMMFLLFGLIISHYSLLYVFVFYLLVALILLHVLKMKSSLTISFVVISVVAGLVWFVYTAGGESLSSIVRLANIVSDSMFFDFFNPTTRGPTIGSALGLGGTGGLVHTIGRGVFYLVQVFIAVGVVRLLRERRRPGLSEVLVVFSAISMVFLVASVILPSFSEGLNMSRIYQITLLFLAPACVVGGKTIFEAVSRVLLMLSRCWLHKPRILRGMQSDVAVAVVVVIFLLFNTGFVYEVAMASPTSISLSYASMKQSDDVAVKAYFYSAYIPAENIASALWLPGHVANISGVCGDLVEKNGVLCSYAGIYMTLSAAPSNILSPRSSDRCVYVYLSYLNVVEGTGTGPNRFGQTWSVSQVSYLLQDRNTVYSNGGSEILV